MIGLFSTPDIKISAKILDAGTRMDAICSPADGVWIIGGRRYDVGTVGGAGKIWKTADGGQTITLKTTLPGQPNINAMDVDKDGKIWILTGQGQIWCSSDLGETYHLINPAVSNSSTTQPTLTYGLCCLPSGTILVTDTRTGGGKIWRSTNQAVAFSDVGTFTTAELYRLLKTGDGVVVNGWAGKVLKSTDDGIGWPAVSSLSAAPVYAIGYLGNHVVLAADANGEVFRSENDGSSFASVGILDGAADDMASLGDGQMIYTPYTSQRNVYFSDNYGKAYRTRGPQPLDGQNDNIDRMAAGTYGGKPLILAGTTLGKIVRISQN